MATMQGKRWRRQSAASKRLDRSMKKLSDAQSATARYFTQRQCHECDPVQWVRVGDWEIHRANYHRPGGYQYERRKAQEQAAKDAEKTMQAAAKSAQKQAARPTRPANESKTNGSGRRRAGSGETKGNTVTQPQGGTNGSTWTSPVARKSTAGGGDGGPSTLTTTEAVTQLVWTWARQVPPSIPAAKADAAAAAEMWRQIADALRHRARLEGEQNKIPPDCLEPYSEAATRVSQVGDQHMEVVKRVTVKYGEVARVLADPRTPDADYLRGGA